MAFFQTTFKLHRFFVTRGDSALCVTYKYCAIHALLNYDFKQNTREQNTILIDKYNSSLFDR